MLNRRSLLGEYIGKGVALGLLAVLAAQKPDVGASLLFGGCTLTGLAIALILAAWRNRGIQGQGKRSVYLLYLLLEYPALMHLGILGGMFAGAIVLRLRGDWEATDLYWAFGIGILIGFLFAGLRLVRHVWWRRGIIFTLAVIATAGLIWTLDQYGRTYSPAEQTVFGGTLLAVIPVLYLLTFTGRAEETELEIGIVCIALGIALWLLVPPTARLMALAFPLMLYVFYTLRYLRQLQTFKHTLRGMSYMQLGQLRPAILSFRRALQLSPEDRLAREQFWRLHRELDVQTLKDPAVLQLVDFQLCLDRAGELLLSGSPPAPERIDEAQKLLHLVLEQRPEMLPSVYYWQAVAHTHRQEFDKAENDLRTLLDDAAATPDQKPYRQTVLVPAWQLALTQHPELKKQVGEPLLQQGRRFAAIAAVEEALAREPQHAGAMELKPLLYHGLTLAEYQTEAGTELLRAASVFDHAYCAEIGTPLLGDPQRWRGGVELLRIASRGLPQQGPAWLKQCAQAAEEAGDERLAKELTEQLTALARQVGVKDLSPEAREAYFSVVKQTADRAFQAGKTQEAIDYFTLYMESDNSGQDTVRMLTELYESLEQVPGALYYNERCLMYDGSNPLYLERKDRYYYSLMPEEYRRFSEQLEKVFDLDYCVTRGKKLIEVKNSGPEQVDWALHLAHLALAVDSENVSACVLAARAHLRRGEPEDALLLLEKAKAGKERVKSAADDEAWYLSCRLLGDLYLQTGRPDQALECLKAFRSSSKSGADTIYKMAQAYEQLGDRQRASKLYENVTAYEGNPLADEARYAMDRLAAMSE